MIILPWGAQVRADTGNMCGCGHCEPVPPVWQDATVALFADGVYFLEKTFGTWLDGFGVPTSSKYLLVSSRALDFSFQQGSMQYVPAPSG